jgi:Effector Associated Constant Component 1
MFSWLAGEEEFRGRVWLVEAALEPGTLGGWPETVAALSQGGVVTILASAVITWIRYRTSAVTCS